MIFEEYSKMERRTIEILEEDYKKIQDLAERVSRNESEVIDRVIKEGLSKLTSKKKTLNIELILGFTSVIGIILGVLYVLLRR
jgi:hypothetical protein